MSKPESNDPFANDLFEKGAVVAAVIQQLCRFFAAQAEKVGDEEAYEQMVRETGTVDRTIFERMIKMGRSPTSHPTNEYLALGEDVLRLFKPPEQNSPSGPSPDEPAPPGSPS